MRSQGALLVLAFVAGLASTASFLGPMPEEEARAPSPPRSAPYVDADGDRIEDALEEAFADFDGQGALQVIVRMHTALDRERLEQLQAAHGGWEATSSWPNIRGFAAAMTEAQVRSLASEPGLRDITLDHPTTIAAGTGGQGR